MIDAGTEMEIRSPVLESLCRNLAPDEVAIKSCLRVLLAAIGYQLYRTTFGRTGSATCLPEIGRSLEEDATIYVLFGRNVFPLLDFRTA
jgi:hypothetical protein